MWDGKSHHEQFPITRVTWSGKQKINEAKSRHVRLFPSRLVFEFSEELSGLTASTCALTFWEMVTVEMNPMYFDVSVELPTIDQCMITMFMLKIVITSEGYKGFCSVCRFKVSDISSSSFFLCDKSVWSRCNNEHVKHNFSSFHKKRSDMSTTGTALKHKEIIFKFNYSYGDGLFCLKSLFIWWNNSKNVKSYLSLK